MARTTQAADDGMSEGKDRGKGPMPQGGTERGVTSFPPLRFPSPLESETELVTKFARRTGNRGEGSSRAQGERRHRTDSQAGRTSRDVMHTPGSSIPEGTPCYAFRICCLFLFTDSCFV